MTKKTSKDKAKKRTKKFDIREYVSGLFVGRITRINYFVGQVVVALGVPIVVGTVGLPLLIVGPGGFFIILALIAWAISILYWASFATRRFHDIGKGNLSVLLLLIPLVNIYFSLVLLFKSGDEKANEYGKAPKRELNLKDAFKIE